LAEEERDVKRTARRPARIVATGVVAVGAALTLSGCVLASPAVTKTPYPASDGNNGSITDPATKSTVNLANFLVVTTAKGAPGSLVGSVVNSGSTDVTVQLSVAPDGAATSSLGQVTVPAAAGKSVKIEPDATALTLPSVPQPPGSVLTLVATTSGGGSVRLTIPVMAANNEYSTLTPSATPTDTPSESTSATPSASATN
jgi:hypothetical protein